MSLLEKLHHRLVFTRRVDVLATHLAKLLPQGARVLDIGCGDGLIAASILARRPDVTITGIDVLERRKTHIQVGLFDGETIPYPDDSFDTALFVDVLHHTLDPMILLTEAKRVATTSVIIKDHCRDGLLAQQTLLFMDWVGNAHQGVALPYNYWSKAQWTAAFAELGLSIESWEPHLGLYPWPASLLFDRQLHYVAALRTP